MSWCKKFTPVKTQKETHTEYISSRGVGETFTAPVINRSGQKAKESGAPPVRKRKTVYTNTQNDVPKRKQKIVNKRNRSIKNLEEKIKKTTERIEELKTQVTLKRGRPKKQRKN